MSNTPYRILHRDNRNDIYPYFEFDTTKFDAAESALEDAKKEYPDEECVIVKLCHLKPIGNSVDLPSTWISYLPDE